MKYTFDPVNMVFKPKNEPKYLRYIKMTIVLILAAACVAFYFWLYISVFHLELPKTAILRRRHAEWEAKMDLFSRQLDIYDQTLAGIEFRDDDVYRAIYGLNEIPEKLKKSGLEGANRYSYIDENANVDLKIAVRRLDRLSKRAYLQSKALDEVSQVAIKAGDMISCVPSVPPIIPLKGNYRLSSPFGYRIDPIYGSQRMHTGQDFAMKKGEPVFATGDGVVEVAAFHFGGYGNEVVIDHGYGYQTRYAHLQTIEVTNGMKIQRGDRIGTVGNTGKSTGPHLHYEVIFRGAKVNPRNYMDTTMPEDEYIAMIEKRQEESPIGKRSSTAELLRQRRASNE